MTALLTTTTAKRWQNWPMQLRRKVWRACGYVPHFGQNRIHQSEARFRVAACGTRWGKSFMGAAEIIPVLLTPGTNTWIIVPSYQFIWVWQWLMTMLIELGVIPGCVKKLNEQTPRSAGYLELDNGSWVMVKSADRPGGLLGAELDLEIVDEAARIPAIVYTRYLRGRLVSRKGRLFVPSTPSGATGWVRDMHDQGKEQAANNWEGIPWEETIESWQVPSWHNPYLDMTEILAAKHQLPELVFQEQFEAAFTTLSGRIFPEYRWETHVVHTLPAGWQHWPRWRAIDFGWSNPAGVVFLALEPGVGRWWVLGEIYGSQLQYAELATLIREHPLSKPLNRVVGTLGDSEDPQGHAALSANGVPVSNEVTRLQAAHLQDGTAKKVKLDKSVFSGLMTVKARLKGDGRGPRLIFASPEAFENDRPFMEAFDDYLDNSDVKNALYSKFRDPPAVGPGCSNILYEMDSYVWDEQDDHQLDKPKAHQADHLIDPIRYLLHTIDPLEAPAIRAAAAGGSFGDTSSTIRSAKGEIISCSSCGSTRIIRTNGTGKCEECGHVLWVTQPPRRRQVARPGGWARRYR